MTRITNHTPKIHDCITCINSLFAYHKNDLEILMVVMVYAGFPNRTVKLKDIMRSSFHSLHALYGVKPITCD